MSLVTQDECQAGLPVAMRVSVVPVSTIPAVVLKIAVDVPYRMDWLMPQNNDAGDVRVSGLSRVFHNAAYMRIQRAFQIEFRISTTHKPF